ncbi:hypothetical protein J1TS1_18070 [Shouchella clausii]|jgi:hypothetical protein|nr:hypothetical protein DB29_02170 [Shouchella clausii]GIN07662.1 hypothetical protein J1TS1_18070 [Shouchella clausii]
MTRKKVSPFALTIGVFSMNIKDGWLRKKGMECFTALKEEMISEEEHLHNKKLSVRALASIGNKTLFSCEFVI